jgi:hypothetical protein
MAFLLPQKKFPAGVASLMVRATTSAFVPENFKLAFFGNKC